MIQLTDRGSLKWPSQPLIEATITLWNLYLQIETNPEIFAALIKSQPRSVLAELTVQKIVSNDCELWRHYCSDCHSFGCDIFRKIIQSTNNCILSKQVKNMNSSSKYAAEARKIKKFKCN